MRTPGHRLWRRIAKWGPERMTLWVALVVAFLTLALLTHGEFLRPTQNGLYLAAQVVNARQDKAELTEQNRKLQALYEFLQTPAGKELAARSEVMALKPGERLIVLSEAAEKAKQPETLLTRTEQVCQRIGDAVVGEVRYAREVATVYSRVGQTPAEAAEPKSDAGSSQAKPASK